MRCVLGFLFLTSCATAAPMAPSAAPITAVDAAPIAASDATHAAPMTPAGDALVRREEPFAQIADAKLVTEIRGASCRVGLEIPIAPAMVSVKSGAWLVMPSAACESDPDVDRATDFILWRSTGTTSVENESPDDRASALSVPIAFLPPAKGLEISRRLLAALPASASTLRSENRLEILDDDGALIRDRARLSSLCKTDNSEACLVAAGAAKDPERRLLLERSCALDNRDGCYALGLDLRSHALEAIRRTQEVRELLDFNCGMGRRTALTPILANEAAACSAAPAVLP